LLVRLSVFFIFHAKEFIPSCVLLWPIRVELSVLFT
jgi:hypothetical protein